MDEVSMGDIIKGIEKFNANLQVELLVHEDARELLDKCARARKLLDFSVAALTRKIDDAAAVAKATGTSMGSAKATVNTGKAWKPRPT